MRSKVSLPTMSGLKASQSVTMARWYIGNKNWSEVRQRAIAENIFDSSRESTSNRYAANLIKIMSSLNDEQMGIVADGDDSEVLSFLWLGFCKAYPLVGDFAKEVIHEHYINKAFNLSVEDLWEYFIIKSDENPDLKEIGESSKKKIQSVIFYNLRDAGLLSAENELQTAMLSKRALAFMDYDDVNFFPFQGAY